jgi:hypothetical protein
MSKEVTDILGRMQGNFVALKGMYTKLAPIPDPSNPTIQQEAYPIPAQGTAVPLHEDYEFTQRLLKDISQQALDASAAIDKALNVPQQPGQTPPPQEPPPEAGHLPGGPPPAKSEPGRDAKKEEPSGFSHKK